MARVAPRRRRQAIDALAYAVVVTTLSFLSGAIVSLLVGGGWLVVEIVMFLEGWLLFGYGTFKLRPAPAWKQDRGGVRGKVRETLSLSSDSATKTDSRIEQIVTSVPRLDEQLPHPDDRISIGVKVFLAAIVVLTSSFLLERAVVV